MSSIFSQIINRELPGHFVYEDDLCVVIMTIQPRNPGHMLVIPRREIDHWDDLEPTLLNHLMSVSQRMAKALKVSFPAERVGVIIAGLDVAHVHIHVFAANNVGDFDLAQCAMADSEQLAQAAASLRAALDSKH